MRKHKIAIVGATGMVGQKIIQVLEERKIKAEYHLFSSARSAGKVVEISDISHIIRELCDANIEKYDFALFAAGGKTSEQWAHKFIEKGCTVIDNSSVFRMKRNISLIVPEVNADKIKGKLIANPNCSTIAAVVPLKPLHDAFGLKRVVYSTYQAISGAGANPTFPYPIENNLIPQIDVFQPDGYTKEEHKMINETKKILGLPKLRVTATTVRVPITNVHCISINATFKNPVSVAEARRVLAQAPGVVLFDSQENLIYPMPIVADDLDPVFVGRLRLDTSCKNTLNMFVACDNIRKGAATNAVQILERLI